jgi:FAD dependent oxidoreductase
MIAQFYGFYHRETRVVRGIGEEFVERIEKAGGSPGFVVYNMGQMTTNPISIYGFPTNPEITKIVADEMIAEAGIPVLFHTLVVGVLMEGERVTGVVTEGISGRREFHAKVIVDATADAIVASKAGAEMTGEEEEGRKTRIPPALEFRLTDVDVPRFRALPTEEKRRIVLKGLQQKELFWENLNFPACTPANNDGILNVTRITSELGLDTLNDEDLSRAEMIGRQQVKIIVNFLRREVPGFEKCNLVGIAARLGVRETRRVVGLYTLTIEDVYRSTGFDDAVAMCCGPVDVHEHGGTGIFLKWQDRPFQVPMRCLIPASPVEGVVVTGRAISTKRPATYTVHTTGAAVAIAHGGGTIAAVAAKKGILPRNVNVKEVQKILRENGAVLSHEDIR